MNKEASPPTPLQERGEIISFKGEWGDVVI